MENDQRVENDTIPCLNYCGAEINLQNREVHLKTCPLALVECGWCGLRQSRNVFTEHIRLANPEKDINHEQQCMQRQCTNLSKQQNKFSMHIQKQDDAIQRLSDDVKNLNQKHSEFSSQFQQYITWKNLIAYTVFMLIINFIYYHYWLQSQQAIQLNYEAILSQIDALKSLTDSHTNEIKSLQGIDLGTKKVKYEAFETYHPFTNELNSYPEDADIEWINITIKQLELKVNKTSDSITRLNKSIGDETNYWRTWMESVEKNFTITTSVISKTNDKLNKCHIQLTLAETERNFTTTELNNLRLQVKHQLNLITKLNQSMLTDTNFLMEIEETFARKVDLKSEVNGQVTELSQSILNEMKQQLIEIKENFTLVTINISEVNYQLRLLNQSMLNGSKHWLKQLTEVNETFTKKLTNFSSELYALKLTHSNTVMDGEKQCSQPADSTYENQKVVELKLLEQSTKFLFDDNELNQTLPIILKLPNYNENMKNTEQCYGSLFLAFNGGYSLIVEVCVSPGYGDCNGTDVSVFLRLIKGPYDDELQQLDHWPLRGTFTVELLDQFDNNNYYSQHIIFSIYTCRQCTERVMNANVKAKRWGHEHFTCHNVTQQSRGNKHLYFNVSYIDINPPIPCNQTAPVILKMCNLTEKKNNAEQWYSSPFFAFHEGYQVCLKVYTTGYDKDKDDHISIFIHLMKGQHDDKLQQSGHWPLRGTFIIKLLNQHNDHHYSKNITFGKYTNNCDKCNQRVIKGDIIEGWGLSRFLSHRDITDYLKNECLNFEIFYEDIATDPPDPSSDQTKQAYYKNLLFGIPYAIGYILGCIFWFIFYLIKLIVYCVIMAVAYMLRFTIGLIYVLYYVVVVAYDMIIHTVFM